MGEKFCGCMKYRTLAWIALAIQIVPLVLMLLPAGAAASEVSFIAFGWPLFLGYIAKIVLLSVTLCCCKKDACPRIAAAVLIFVFVGLEIIWLIWVFIFINFILIIATGWNED